MSNAARKPSLTVAIKKSDIESEIENYKELSIQIKALEAKKERLKASLVKSYFASNDEYINKDGVTLATYRSQIRQAFSTTDFKEAHPKLYEDFTKPQKLFVFLVK